MTGDQTRTTDSARDGDYPRGVDDGSVDHEKARRGTRLLLESIGVDPDAGELEETWQRRVPQLVDTLSEGYREHEKPVMRTFDVDGSGDGERNTGTDGLVIKTGIPLYSLCEHHLLPYTGRIHVAYRPNGAVVGLSKLTRYVRWRSRRLTVQERLTDDIATGLAAELETNLVLVAATATHLCEAMRGVEAHSQTRTSATVGDPTDAERRQFRSAIDRTEGGR